MPTRPASQPQRMLPVAMLPKNTARLTASPRERTQAGSAIWAETLRLESTEIQARPARTQAGSATGTMGTRARAAMDRASAAVPETYRPVGAEVCLKGWEEQGAGHRAHPDTGQQRAVEPGAAGRADPAPGGAGAPRARCRTGRSRRSGPAWRATARCCGHSAGRRGWRRRSARQAARRRASVSAPPEPQGQDHGDEAQGVEDERPDEAQCGDDQAAQGRADGAGDVDADAVQRDRLGQQRLGHEVRGHRLPGRCAERGGGAEEEGEQQEQPGRDRSGGHDQCQGDGEAAGADLQAEQQPAAVDQVGQGTGR